MVDAEEVVKINPKIETVTEARPDLKCQFCLKHEINELEWGPMYKLDKIVVHYYCMLFSAALTRKGTDKEGILGFLEIDLKKEMKRGQRLRCKYCKNNKATVGCIISDCKASYHFPCGLANGTMNHFTGHFESYCQKHKKLPKLPFKVPAEGVLCEICLDNVLLTENWVWPPCCKLRLYHRFCMQEYAKRAGYSFSCPSCKDTCEFIDAMKTSGVFVPDQEAAWERDPTYFLESNELDFNCDAEECNCLDCGNYDAECIRPANTNWEIVRCGDCGSSSANYYRGQFKRIKWSCGVCVKVTSEDAQVVMNSSKNTDDSSGYPDVDESVLKEYEKAGQDIMHRASKDAQKPHGMKKTGSIDETPRAHTSRTMKHGNKSKDIIERPVCDSQMLRLYSVDAKCAENSTDEEHGKYLAVTMDPTSSNMQSSEQLQSNTSLFHGEETGYKLNQLKNRRE